LRTLVIFSFIVAILLLLTGTGAISGAYLRSRDMPDGFGWKPPMEQVSNRDLAPASALLPLTGLAAEDALDQTLEGDDLESAFAIIAYDPVSPTLRALARCFKSERAIQNPRIGDAQRGLFRLRLCSPSSAPRFPIPPASTHS
jgi:hypothetical protein